MSDPLPSVTVWGAGSVGLALGARLSRAGLAVRMVCRTHEAADAIARAGVEYEDLGSGDRFVSRVDTAASDGAAGLPIADGPVLLCVRTSHTERAMEQIHTAAPDCDVVCVQNGMDAEDLLLRRFRRVIGAVYRQTCTRGEANRVVSIGGGRMVVGVHPTSEKASDNDRVEKLAAHLRRAGYDVGVSPRIREDKWLKLVVNLMSAPNALIRPADHSTEAFVEIKVRLLEEARDVLAAAGIVARSCDGRDRSVDEEIRFQRESLVRGQSARRIPLYNQVWSSLRRGSSVEADGYHRRILSLAAEHGVVAPMNESVLAALEEAIRESRGPETVVASELLAAVP